MTAGQQIVNKRIKEVYWMEITSLNKQCTWLESFLQVDPVMSGIRTEKAAITVEVVVNCLIRWLAAGSHVYVQIVAQLSGASF